MGATVGKVESGRQVLLEGHLTLPHAETMKKAFLTALIEADDVFIKFAIVENVDLSCLQLLCSAHRSAVCLKKRISIEGSVPQALKKAADAAGFSCLTGCKLDSDRSCLWIAVKGVDHG